MTAAFDSDVTLTIELAFGDGALEASPTWTDVTSYARAVEIRRGRSNVLGRFEAGTASITFDNRTGRFTPDNTAGAYHPDVKVGVPVRVRATYDGNTYDLFRGVVESWPIAYSDKGKNSLATVPCVDGFKLLAQFDLSTESYSAESADTRIGNVLDDVGWPAGLRSISSGLSNVQAFTPTETDLALSHLMDVAEAEVGALFVNSGGTVVFQNRAFYSGGPSSGGTFSPSGIPFHDLSVAPFDDEYLWNDARVTRDGGEMQQYVDQSSIDTHGRRVLVRDVMPNNVDPEAFDSAVWLVGMFSEVRTRIESLVLVPRSSPTDLWPHVLGRDLRDAVTVEFDPPSGDSFSQVVAIQSIEHRFDAQKNWTTRWNVAPLSDLEQLSFWTWDTSSVWDTDVFA